MELWREVKKMVYIERKRSISILEYSFVKSFRIFLKKKRFRLEFLIRFLDDIIIIYEEQYIYFNLNVKCFLVDKFEYCGRKMKNSDFNFMDMLILIFIDVYFFLSDGEVFMFKLFLIEMEDGVFIMLDKNRDDFQVSFVGDIYYCMVVNLQFRLMDIYKRVGSLFFFIINNSEISLSDEERIIGVGFYSIRLVIIRSMFDVKC